MISFAVDRDFTRDSDQIISDEEGIPHMYIGRGAYSGKLEIYHFVQDIKKVHLLYVGRYTAIAQNLKIYSDYNNEYVPEGFTIDGNTAYKEMSFGTTNSIVITDNTVVIPDNENEKAEYYDPKVISVIRERKK